MIYETKVAVLAIPLSLCVFGRLLIISVSADI